MYTHENWMGYGMWFFGIILIVVVVLLIRGLVTPGAGPGSSLEHHESPLETLKARYARGEIDDEEFKRRKQELE